ncbi:phospholipid-binding protein MlaC [Halothiobacillus sp. DCM-1]|uniref:MlaC/ttg2D family ABC transporter substrate-binding protein n=1 Tax=Halothiobacillus sp. DCM-1 TaxID=3112558 RepID=UPI00324D6C72
MNRLFALILTLVGLFSGVPAQAETAPAAGAEAAMQMVQQTADTVIKEIAAQQAAVQKDPAALLAIVNKTLLPHVDSERMSRLVLGRYWRTATPAQKTAFTEQFQQLLVRTYAGPLSKLGNQTIKVTGTKPGPETGELVVESDLLGGDMGRVPVNYRVALVNGQWQAFDVVIDGISLINNYRGSFAEVIQRKGLDGLIATLKSQNNG